MLGVEDGNLPSGKHLQREQFQILIRCIRCIVCVSNCCNKYELITMLEHHNLQWRSAFNALQIQLQQALHDYTVDIQHVGSTSIPGLVSKPILDIDIVIGEEHWLPGITERLVGLGYLYKGEQGIAGRFAFRQSSAFTPQAAGQPVWMAHHLYVCYAHSLALKNHLVFRDALLKDTALVQQYATLKQALAASTGMNREKYTKAKTDFILAVLAANGFAASELAAIAAANR
jgi:GrpB-like predicted nucleotidyltransferase (UPF0157 family)